MTTSHYGTAFRHRLVSVGALMMLLALFVSCGAKSEGDDGLPSAGSSASTPDESSSSASSDPQDAMLKFAQCMRENGVDMPDPKDGMLLIGPEAGDPATMEAAQAACGDLLEGAMPDAGEGPPMTEEDKQKLLDAAQCMRDRGYDYPDPEFDGGGFQQEIGGDTGLDPQDPAFQADIAACESAAGVDTPQFNGPGS